MLVDFLCHQRGGELVAGDDASEVRRFTAEEVAELPLVKETKEVI